MPKSRKRKMFKLTPKQEQEHLNAIRKRVHKQRQMWAKGLSSLAAYQTMLEARKLA